MARHKEFEEDEVLQKAMEVFWVRGFNGASMSDLVTHMGINRQSIYDTFGDKHALYLKTLDRYRDVEGGRIIAMLDQPGSVKRALRQVFENVIETSSRRGQRRGCFIGNAMSELGGRCRKTAAKTCSNMAATEEAFHRALMRGKLTGEFEHLQEPRAVARFLYASLQGLTLMAKASQDPRAMEDVVRVTLSVVSSQETGVRR